MKENLRYANLKGTQLANAVYADLKTETLFKDVVEPNLRRWLDQAYAGHRLISDITFVHSQEEKENRYSFVVTSSPALGQNGSYALVHYYPGRHETQPWQTVT